MRKICILLFLTEVKIKERIVILMKEKLEAISKMSKEKIAEILRDNQNTAELQRKKQVLEGRLESERKELEACNRLFLDFFSNSAITYFMLPLMDQG